ncbi:hypothetical protein [Streptomyces chartreusis]|uniref:hypothetical protein n=1 Tax=Streptomyces chartreusis TaxID=1969 RepID=UPI003662DD37
MVYEKLRDPSDAMAEELRVRDREVQRAREQMESIRSALGAMVNGHVTGLFDDQTSIGPDWDAPIQSVDISALEQYATRPWPWS